MIQLFCGVTWLWRLSLCAEAPDVKFEASAEGQAVAFHKKTSSAVHWQMPFPVKKADFLISLVFAALEVRTQSLLGSLSGRFLCGLNYQINPHVQKKGVSVIKIRVELL